MQCEKWSEGRHRYWPFLGWPVGTGSHVATVPNQCEALGSTREAKLNAKGVGEQGMAWRLPTGVA